MAEHRLDESGPSAGITIERLQRLARRELRAHWQRFIVEGVVLALIGIGAIILPNIATLAIAVLVGWLLFVAGAVGTIAALGARSAPGFVYSLALSVLTAALGAMLALQPVAAILTLTIALIAYFIAQGVGKIMLATSMRDVSRHWPALLLSAVVDFILAGIVISGWPGTAGWVMGLLLGVNLLFYGIGLVFAAIGAHADTPAATISSRRPSS